MDYQNVLKRATPQQLGLASQAFQANQLRSQPTLKSSGHGVLDLLPGLVGTLGAIGGGALGSVLPGAGTLAGGAAGAGLGQAAGKWLENLTTGDKTSAGDLAKEGAFGAGTELIGGPVLGLLGKLGGKVAGAGAGMLEKQSANETAKLLQQELPHGTDTTGIQDVLARMQEHGIQPTAENIGKFGDAGRAMTDIQDNLVSQGNPVPVSLDNLLKEAFRKQPGLGAIGQKGTQANQIAGGLRNLLGDTVLSGDAALSGMAHPSDVLQATRALYEAKPASGAEGKIYESVRNQLTDLINKEGGVGDIIKNYQVTPSEKQYLLEQAGGNESMANAMESTLNGANRIQDIQKAVLPHVAANKIANSAAEVAGKALPAGTKPNDVLARLLAGTSVGLAPLTHGASLATPAALGIRSAAASGVGQKISGQALKTIGGLIGRGADLAQTAAPIATGAARLTSEPALNAAQPQPQTQPVTGTQAEPGASQEPGLQVPQTAGDLGSSPQGVFSPQTLEAMALKDIQTTGGKNLDKILTLQKMFPSTAGNGKGYTGTVAGQLADSQSALRGLQGIRDQISGGQGALGPIQGALASLNPYDANQQAFQSQLNTVAQQVAKGLEGGKLSDQDIKRYRQMMPNVKDTRETALKKIDNIMTSLQARLGDYSSLVNPNSNGTDLQSVLGG